MNAIQPLVSILMPCYKGQAYLPAAIESCLAQTHANFELICVDDKSPDNCLQIMRSYAAKDPRIRVVERTTNGGQARAFQTALDASRGEYVTRLAQDDLLYPRSLEYLVEALQQHPEVALVYGDQQRIDEEGNVIRVTRTREPHEALLPCNRLGLYVMWRREVHEKAGGFVPDSYAEDYDLLLQISIYYKLYRVQAAPPGLGFREHAGQASHREKRLSCDTVRAHIHYHRTLMRLSPWSLRRRLKIIKSRLRLAYMLVTPVSMHASPSPE
jgi:glycosyltransferase involved in cell wall biosynthesis